MTEIVITLSRVKNYNSNKVHYEAPYLTGEDMENIQYALEKQMPKKPDIEGDGYDNEGNIIYDTWICPNCKEHYEMECDDYDFCPKCGQAIDTTNIERLVR